MAKSFVVILFAAGLVLLFCLNASAQQPGTIPQFSTIETHEYDTINLGTLGIQLNVPIRSKAGHIPYNYRLAGASQITVHQYTDGPGFQLLPGLLPGEAHIARQLSITTNNELSSFTVTDSLGNSHVFTFTVSTSCLGTYQGGGYAIDNSGLYLLVTNNKCSWTYQLWDMEGNSQTETTSSPYFSIMTDPSGNSISASTDTLAETVMAGTGVGTRTLQPSETFIWTDALGNDQTVTLTNSSVTVLPAFGCAADSTSSGSHLPESISLPDQSSIGFSWERNPLTNTDYTGRIASITLPTGGTIGYSYSGGTNGINCIDGTPATMQRTTPDGTWTYTHVAPATYSGGTSVLATTTVQDPKGNNAVYTFNVGTTLGSTGNYGITVEAEKQVYNGSVKSANLIETVITCYNNTSSSPTNCPGSAPVAITEKDVYTTYPGATGYSAAKTSYDSYGRISELKTYDFGLVLVSDKLIQYGTGNPTSQSCAAIGTTAPGIYIIDKPCSVTLKDSSGNILSQTWNSYDTKGNLSQTWNLVSGSGASGVYLSKQYTYSQGVVQTMTDVNGQVVNYTTTSCNNMFVTSQYPTNFSNLQTSQTWDCNGGVVTSSTDANSTTTHTDFYVGTTTDPFYRPLDTKDELGYTTTYTYQPNSTESILLFNNSRSVVDTLSTTDSIGRPVVAQLRQAPGSSNWDTRSRSFDGDGRINKTTLPCVTTIGAPCTTSTDSHTYDALNRPLVHTGTGGDVVTKSYPANDVLTILTPPPTNENAKQTQKEYDGLGRLKSICVISSVMGSGSCKQVTGATGFLTTYAYDGAGRLLQVVQNAQVSSPQQTRSYTYDKLGRMLTESNPESIKTYYTYDSVSGTNCASTSNGDLVEKQDANGNISCYFYDGLHRNTYITYTGPNSNGVSKYFVYDAATVDGVAMGEAEGRLAEAYTCAGSSAPPCSPKTVDVGYSYGPRGMLSGLYESTPNSSGYYYHYASYWADRSIETIAGANLPGITYGASDGSGLDGEGRVTSVTATSGMNLVNSVSYNNATNSEPVGALMGVTVGSGDAENFTYDQNTGRMLSYSAAVGTTPTLITGSLSWNANGTLQQLSVSDGYNAANTQVCSYLYDDYIRVAGTTGSTPIPGVNCVNGTTKIWNQTFSFDSFGNMTKTTTGPGVAFACATCYNETTNQYNSVLSGNISYDNNGNLLNDNFHTYTWLPDGHLATIDTSTITYDAEGNRVEENVGGTIHEYVSAFGITAQMTGQTENATLIDLPGGVQALYSRGTLQRFRYSDWQGSIRAESNPTTRQFTESLAFAPFGERYALMGAPFNVDSFTGKSDQIVSDEYDFPAREEHNGQGRWISPDPMRGTGNKYVYADNNPLSKVDIYGMYAIEVNGLEVGDSDDTLSLFPTVRSESAPPQSQVTGGQTTASSSGNGSASSSTQTPASQQQAQTAQGQQQGQGAKEAQNTPLSSVTVLGNKVGITYGAKLSAADQLAASNAIAASADLINKNASSLTPDQTKAIGQISSFAVSGPNTLLGATGKGSMTLSISYIHDSSAAWLGSLFGHEGQHYLNSGKYSGANLWRDEQSAGRTQLGIGNKIGFSSAERQYLEQWIDDRNRAAMQQHMEQGYSQ